MRVGDVVIFIKDNRRGKAYVDWSDADILNHVLHCISLGTIHMITNPEGNIVGVTTALPQPENILYITGMLTTVKGLIPEFIKEFERRFPGFKLAGQRYGKIKNYDTPKLVKKFKD